MAIGSGRWASANVLAPARPACGPDRAGIRKDTTMTGITSGVGLLSGFPIQDIVDQLMAIEARPLNLLQARKQVLQTQRTAFMELNARLLSLKSTVSRFDEALFFRAFKASSSNSSVLVATAGENAVAGEYTFQVKSLVTNHQTISQGFADSDRTPVGAGTLSVEIGRGKLQRDTSLASLNGGQGVRRGTIRIFDTSGDFADVDLTTALTIDDVLDAINSVTAIGVEAAVKDDAIILTDTSSTPGAGNIRVEDRGGGHTAEDLGIDKQGVGVTLTGDDVNNLTGAMQLSVLNDGAGISHAKAGGDFQIQARDGTTFDVDLSGIIKNTTRLEQLNNGGGVRLGEIRITDRAGNEALIDLTGATTTQDVIDAINNQSDADVEAILISTSSISAINITDKSGSTAYDLKIKDVSGFAARDLGIAGEADEDKIEGTNIFSMRTIGDVMRAVSYATNNNGKVTASISGDGNSLTLTDLTGSTAVDLTVTAIGDSTAAADLGLLKSVSAATLSGEYVLAGLNTVLLRNLNGGSGIQELGQVDITLGDSTTATVDFSGVQTVQELLDRINEDSVLNPGGVEKVRARLNAAGNGVTIEDLSGGGGPLVIADVGSGTTASDLSVAGTFTDGTSGSGNLQLRYISLATAVSELNYGGGITAGRFTITNRSGQAASVNISGSEQTVGDIIDTINAAGAGANITARINDSGDGILIEDASGGTGEALKIEDDEGGTAAQDLNIAGESETGENFVDGSYEIKIGVDGDDTLDDVVDKINSLGGQFVATIINDGSGFSPFRLSLTSKVTGTAGEMLIDPGDTNLSFDTLVRARDAVVFFGSGGETPIVLTSSSNTLNNVVRNVSIDLVGTGDDPVTVSVTQDVDSIAADMDRFVQAYNEVIDRIDDLTSYDSETHERGLLLGDTTINRIRDRLFRMVTRQVPGGEPGLDRLTSIGLSFGNGGRLSFDEEKFHERYAANPQGVEELFTLVDEGAGVRIDEELEELTRSYDGLLATRDQSLQDREDQLDRSIEHMSDLLDRKRTRVEAQFQAMERALAQLQMQQSALSSLATLTQQFSFGSST